LAEVYVELIGARQANLGLAEGVSGGGESACDGGRRSRPPAAAGAADRGGGARRSTAPFIATLGEAAIWRQYVPG